MDNGKELRAVREVVGGELVQVSCEKVIATLQAQNDYIT